MTNKTTHIRIPIDLLWQLKAQAVKERKKPSDLLIEIIKKELTRRGKKGVGSH